MPEDPSKSTPAELSAVRATIEALTGQPAPLTAEMPVTALKIFSNGAGLGYSQLNELLLLLGFDRVTSAFFQYLADGTTEYSNATTIKTLKQLEIGVERFVKLGLLLFGNEKYAFKTLSQDADLLALETQRLTPISELEFSERHDAVWPIARIPDDKTYYLGYIVEKKLRARLKQNAADAAAQAEMAIRDEIVALGKQNQLAYLASDHLDVYVATSMRERHEFIAVSRIANEIFAHDTLKRLKLRWFDPTQAYCDDRIDKGLSEALMLRRAQCTLYLAQEIDTLGKDSELASTLAQGKPVIALVPEVPDDFAIKLVDELQSTYPELSKETLILRQLRIVNAAGAWENSDIRRWIDDTSSMDVDVAMKLLQDNAKAHYDSRADTLRSSHPLGIQVNLATGVANGVLVARNTDQCARLIWRILSRSLEFELKKASGHLLLVETISDSVFRVMTLDEMLTNAFWNFYLDPST